MAKIPDRHYYRCTDCLSIMAAEGKRLEETAKCGICGGRLWWMGQVEGVRLMKTSQACPCDGRCTGATGPKCDCSCGGENHGSGMVVTVVRDAGDVPVLTPPDKRGKALAIATEWRAALAAIYADVELARLGSALRCYAAGGYVEGYGLYNDVRSFKAAMHDAKASRSHAGRMRKLDGIRKTFIEAR